MAPKLPWQIYSEQMECLGHGHALWEPAPMGGYTRIRIGDVGLILQGRFHLLFSAGFPLGNRILGIDVPSSFRQLAVGAVEKTKLRNPGCVGVQTNRKGATSFDVGESTQSTKPGSDFLIELTGDRGAALTTRYPTYGEDPLSSTLFIGYTKRHYRSWVKFSRDKGYGEHLLPILVSGLDMTKDFAIVAYSNDSTSVQSDAPVYTPMFSHGDASLPWTWCTPASSYQKHGPSRPMSPDLPPLNSRAGVFSTGFDQ
ncbi:hypothetical protein BJ322DRAFT_847885 [Thelephora terrestris]|uniref:Uncharacterized protein n=1 Tax=Thelephora terrestris TaxID=56493 RepID=A0A9P6HCN3_9AGAM|nr:hypothetical protein BJ322DRAFT_847885 [Thelephora terrestris]